MVTDNGLDQLDSVPLSSSALARTLKVFVDPEATVQLWEALAVEPELTRDVVDVVPSPQSNVYFTCLHQDRLPWWSSCRLSLRNRMLNLREQMVLPEDCSVGGRTGYGNR